MLVLTEHLRAGDRRRQSVGALQHAAHTLGEPAFTHAPRGRLTKSCELFPSGEKQRTAAQSGLQTDKQYIDRQSYFR